MSAFNERTGELEAAIASLEARRSVVGDNVVDSAVAALRRQLAELDESPSEPTPQEERKIVTILFADVSGFTALSENLDPEEMRNLINACFERLVPVVKKYEGTVDKFMGDEIMALFGAPIAHENDPERASRVALEMMAAISVFNREQATELDIHVGVNTGTVVAGQIGAPGRRDYSVVGDAVNVAARLRDASMNGEIYVGPNTYRQTAALFDFEKLPPLKLKGKEKPIQIHRLIRLKERPRRIHGIEGLSAPLVGRQSELEEIQSAFHTLRNGNGSILAIVGEAGLGKSRLIADALQSTDLSWAEGRALSYTEGMSYWMARDLLCALLETKANATPEEIETALRASIEKTASGKMTDIYPYLGRLLEIPLPEAALEQIKFLTGEVLQTRILGAFHDYILAVAMRKPLILFWEDLHWCDPSSLSVLETLMALTNEVPLLLLISYRPDPDFVSQLQKLACSVGPETYRILELSPLTREESGSLIRNLLKVENLSEEMYTVILDRAEGNPFFLEELLRSLLDTGIIVVEEDGIVTLGTIENVDVPETLQDVLMARIDRLAPEDKQTLQNASVIGRIFQQRVLADVYGDKAASNGRLENSLAELQRREFIQLGKSSDEREYVFKHAITYDVAYNSLLTARRKQLHGRVGEAIEALFPDRLDELSPTLGYHFERADVREKAISYLRRAGQRAQATFANKEALGFYRSALQQIDVLRTSTANERLTPLAAQIHESIGDIDSLIGQYEPARAAYEKALQRVVEDDVVWSSRLRCKMANTWVIERQYKNAEQSYNEAEMILQNRRSSTEEWQQERLQIQLDRMWLHYWRGDEEITALAERMRPQVEQYATPLQRGKFFHGLTLAALRRDGYTADDETIEHAQISLAAVEKSKVVPEIGQARFILGFSYLWAGKFELAEKWLCEAFTLAEQTGDIVLGSRCLTYLTVIERKRGEIELARDYAERSLASANAARMLEYIGMANGNLAWVDLRNGDVTRAYEHGCNAVGQLGQTVLGTIMLWVALWPLIGVAIARDQTAEAIQHVEKLLVPPQMAVPPHLKLQMRAAVNAWKENNHSKSSVHLKMAADLAGELGYL